MSDENRCSSPGSQVNVMWDGRLCIHLAECGRARGDLFVAGRPSWCQPDLVEPDAVISAGISPDNQ